MEDTKKKKGNNLLLIAGLGVGALALMSFAKKPEEIEVVEEEFIEEVVTKPVVTNPVVTKPVLITDPPIVYQDPIDEIYKPPIIVINPPVITEPLVLEIETTRPPIAYAEPEQYMPPIPEKKLEIYLLKKVSFSLGFPSKMVVDLKFVNNTQKAIYLNDIKWLKIQRTDDYPKFLGNAPVSLKPIKLEPKNFTILKNVELTNLNTDHTWEYHVNLRGITSIFPYFSIDKPDTTQIIQEYKLSDRNIVATPVVKNDTRFVGNAYEMDLDIEFYNSTNSPFSLNTINSVDLYVKYAAFTYVSTTPLYFSDIKIPAYSKITLNNVVLIIPDDFLGQMAMRVSPNYFSKDLQLKLS